jgi:glucan phosphorylase
VNAALSKVGAADGAVVEGWLREEETYLRGLSKEPLEETLEMEYYKMVMNVRESE